MRAEPTVSLSLRLSPKLKDAAARAAEAKKQTLKDYVEAVLTEATERASAIREQTAA